MSARPDGGRAGSWTADEADAIGNGLPFLVPRDPVLALAFLNGVQTGFAHPEARSAVAVARQRALDLLDRRRAATPEVRDG